MTQQSQSQVEDAAVKQYVDNLANEYSEQLDHKRKRLPKIYNMKTAQNVIVKNEKIELSDIFYRSPDSEEIVGTTAIVVLHPHDEESQLRPWKIDPVPGIDKQTLRIYYTVLAGRGSCSVQDLSQPIREGDTFWVEAGVRHSIINHEEPGPSALDLRFVINYAGYFDFRDLYKPYTQGVKKSKDSVEQSGIFKLQPNPEPQPEQQQQGKENYI